jgi:hypothetical protein
MVGSDDSGRFDAEGETVRTHIQDSAVPNGGQVPSWTEYTGAIARLCAMSEAGQANVHAVGHVVPESVAWYSEIDAW